MSKYLILALTSSIASALFISSADASYCAAPKRDPVGMGRLLSLPEFSIPASQIQLLRTANQYCGQDLILKDSHFNSSIRNFYRNKLCEPSSAFSSRKSTECANLCNRRTGGTGGVSYRFGGKMYVGGRTPGFKHGVVDIIKGSRMGNGGTPNGIDCSGFIAATLAHAGLRMKKGPTVCDPDNPDPSDTWSGYDMGTVSLVDNADSNDDCFDAVAVPTEGKIIRAGDIVSWSEIRRNARVGHAIMIHSVGKDPFGFEANGIHSPTKPIDKKIEHCRSGLTPDAFDFSISHSESFSGVGPMITDAKSWFNSTYANPRILLDIVEQMCLRVAVGVAEKQGQKIPLTRLPPLTAKKTTGSTKWAVTRHIGTDECRTPPHIQRRARGVECLPQNCPGIVRRDG